MSPHNAEKSGGKKQPSDLNMPSLNSISMTLVCCAHKYLLKHRGQNSS